MKDYYLKTGVTYNGNSAIDYFYRLSSKSKIAIVPISYEHPRNLVMHKTL